MMRLKSLTYTSRARPDIADRDVSAIHLTARHLNAIDGITGLLIYDGVRFLQIIEGAEEAIDNLVEHLRDDGRHFDFQVRDERFVDHRSFSGWSMELVRVTVDYREARTEVASMLPASTTDAVRDLILEMTEESALAS